MARILSLHSHTVIQAACAIVESGGVLAIPTESYYALAASAWQIGGIRRVSALKGRPAGKPLLVLIAEPGHLDDLVTAVPPAARTLLQRFWPGPLTLVFPATPRVSAELTAHTGTIGIRQPSVPALMPLLHATGPLTGTSANPSGTAPLTTAEAVARTLGHAVDLILDGGPTPGGLPSTLVDVRGPIRVLREGAVARSAIEAMLRDAGFTLAPEDASES